jgi:hypothetical protein
MLGAHTLTGAASQIIMIIDCAIDKESAKPRAKEAFLYFSTIPTPQK